MTVNLTHVLLWLCLATFSTAQLNGEFWWLNEKLLNYTNAKASPPMFEELNEFDNDENTKIVFRDDNLLANKVIRINPEKSRQDQEVKYNKAIVWPAEEENTFSKEYHHFKEVKLQVNESEKTTLSDKTFKFPGADDIKSSDRYEKQNPSNDNVYNTFVTYHTPTGFVNNGDKVTTFQNRCSYMSKRECYQNNGFMPRTKSGKKLYINLHLVCCILDKVNERIDKSSKIYFQDFPEEIRLKRSNEGYKLDQRKILLQRRKSTQAHRTKTTMAPKISTTDYEDDDPYWNIKTANNKGNKKEQTNRYDYDANDYTGDYTVEVPSPGLVGIYSDYSQKPFDRPNKDDEYYDDGVVYDAVDDDEGGFGYSTVDPRKIMKTMSLKRDQNEQPSPESQTVSYSSKPDFNVLQGFKLKIFNDKILPSKRSRKSTTIESILDDNASEDEEVTDDAGDSDREADDDQVYPECGKAGKMAESENNDAQMGEALNGSHPWLALVVPTGKNNVLCYATLIHPRAAVTAAHCVYRKSSGEVSLIAGVWDRNEISRGKSRVPSIRIHPNYNQGNLSNDVALLYWNRSVELGANIQPACLGKPHFGDNCFFYGWSGFDQAIRHQSRWQKATIQSCKVSVSLKNGRGLPDEAFCATVRGRGTVTGMGASLVCPTGNTMSAVGVAVHRDSTVVLLPIQEWVISAMENLKLN